MNHPSVRIPLRLPPDMKSWLEQEAERNFTSQNAEIVRAIRSRMESENQRERAAG
jgi:hypothetical protein